MDLTNNNQPDPMIAEVANILASMRARSMERIEALGEIVAKKRDEAVAGRRKSGIETQWREDQEYIRGVDDANRSNGVWTKSPSMQGGLVSNEGDSRAVRGECTAFFPLTGPFCAAARARICDIMLPVGDNNFAVKRTPLPDIEEHKESAEPALGMDGQPLAGPEGQPLTHGDYAVQALAQADRSAEKAQQWILDKLVECSYHSEARRVVSDCVDIGVGVLYGPYPVVKRRRKVTGSGATITVEMVEEVTLASRRLDPWDCFPDPHCGENIHDGEYFIYRDFLTKRGLLDLKGTPGYLDDQIDKVLEEGPGKCNQDDSRRGGQVEKSDGGNYEVWYFHGYIDNEDFQSTYLLSGRGEEGRQESRKQVPVVLTLVNDTVIRVVVSPINSGEFPVDAVPFERIPGHWAGVGVARKGRTAQTMYLALCRTLVENAGLSAKPMLAIDPDQIVPADGEWTIYGGKLWLKNNEGGLGDSVGQGLMAIDIPSNSADLINQINLAKSMMEESTGIFFLMQGQQGSAPDTVGGMQLLHQNSATTLRQFARNFDDCLTEPHIRRWYYDGLLVDPDAPEDAKGDWSIEAVGSSVLVERAIQEMQILQIAQFALNPAYGVDPELAFAEMLRAYRFDPAKFQISEEKKKQMEQQAPPEAPQITAAKIRAASAEKIAGVKSQTDQAKIKADTDRDAVYVQSQAARDQAVASTRLEELRLMREKALMDREMKVLDYANRRQITLDQAKKDLAQTVLKLRVQKELSAIDLQMNRSNKQVIMPPTEPAGRAKPGHAFEQ